MKEIHNHFIPEVNVTINNKTFQGTTNIYAHQVNFEVQSEMAKDRGLCGSTMLAFDFFKKFIIYLLVVVGGY